MRVLVTTYSTTTERICPLSPQLRTELAVVKRKTKDCLMTSHNPFCLLEYRQVLSRMQVKVR